jgi:hypothetical protein
LRGRTPAGWNFRRRLPRKNAEDAKKCDLTFLRFLRFFAVILPLIRSRFRQDKFADFKFGGAEVDEQSMLDAGSSLFFLPLSSFCFLRSCL